MNILTVLLLLALQPLQAQGWEVLDSGTNRTLIDVVFVNDSTGWAIGDTSLILYTEDGGVTWTEQICPIQDTRFEKAQFLNEQVGYIIGHGGAILSTKDGGVLWEVDTTWGNYWFADLCFLNADTGWVAGNWHDHSTNRHGIVLVTYDGGQHWEMQWNTITLLPSFFFPPWILDVEFSTKEHGYAGLWPLYMDWGPAVIYHTLDGGQTWDSLSATWGDVTIEGGSYMLSVFSDTVWIHGLFSPGVSTNSGITWRKIDTYTVSQGAVVDFMAKSGTTFWVLGGTTSGSVVSYTTDMGATWSIILPDYLPRLRAIYVRDRYNIYAVGKEGLIMHYTDTIISSNGTDALPSVIHLHPAYPNPFNPSTTIRYQLPHAAQVTLNVYDILGREVATLVDGYAQPGSHEAVWDAGGQPSGIYLARLETPDYSKTIKLVLLK